MPLYFSQPFISNREWAGGIHKVTNLFQQLPQHPGLIESQPQYPGGSWPAVIAVQTGLDPWPRLQSR